MPSATRLNLAQQPSCRSRIAMAIAVAASVAALLCLAQLSSGHADADPAATRATAAHV